MTDREIAFSDPVPAVTRRGYTDHQARADMLQKRLEAARREIARLEADQAEKSWRIIFLIAEADKAERRAACLDKRLHGRLAAGRVVRREEATAGVEV